MLTADLVDVRRKSGELILQPFDPRAREEAASVASALLDAARAHEGRRREDLDTAWDAIEHEAERARMAKGLRKLAEDACVFEAGEGDPVALRQRVFRAAAIARREGRFDRAAPRGGLAGGLTRDSGRLRSRVTVDVAIETSSRNRSWLSVDHGRSGSG